MSTLYQLKPLESKKLSRIPLAIDIAALVIAGAVIVLAVLALVALKVVDFFNEIRRWWK